jgi:hypothetical protein
MEGVQSNGWDPAKAYVRRTGEGVGCCAADLSGSMILFTVGVLEGLGLDLSFCGTSGVSVGVLVMKCFVPGSYDILSSLDIMRPLASFVLG